MVPIVYGYPMPALRAVANRGELALRGRVMSENDPTQRLPVERARQCWQAAPRIGEQDDTVIAASLVERAIVLAEELIRRAFRTRRKGPRDGFAVSSP